MMLFFKTAGLFGPPVCRSHLRANVKNIHPVPYGVILRLITVGHQFEEPIQNS